MSKPILHGVKVLDLSHMYPGTLCSWLLAALGAEILKVEAPGAVRTGAPFLNQGKKSIALNLKTDAGREIVHRLAKASDIVLEGFRPGVARRLRVDYDTLRRLNPKLVYCSISSFGQAGPSAAYSASKAGIIGLTATMARELGPYNINVNAIAPGSINTPRWREARNEEQINRTVNATALKRLGEEEDIVGMCLMLASDRSSIITGQAVTIHGGLLCM